MQINKDLRVTDNVYYNLDLDTIAKKSFYTTDEIIVGYWTNGKPIYRAILTGTFQTSAKVDIVLKSNISVLVDGYGLYDVENNTNPRITLGHPMISTGGTTNDAYSNITFQSSTAQIKMRIGIPQTAYHNRTGCYMVILEYVKNN